MSESEELPEITGYERWHVYLSTAVGVVVSLAVIWWVSGFTRSAEALFRVSPTVEGGGIGTDWVVGNTIVSLDLLIALIHAADVIMGVFILLMVFIHWGAFRRLASQMREPDEQGTDALAADGGSERGGEEE
jgi:hypothetical protein